MNLRDESAILEFPESDTSLIDASTEEANFSRYCDNSHLVGSVESYSNGSDSSDDEVLGTSFVPTWNEINGYRRSFTAFMGEAPDYRTDDTTPLKYFYKFCSRRMIGNIVFETNKYSADKGVPLNATYAEIEQYIGVLLHKGIYQSPDYRHYWSPRTPYPAVANVTRRRFDLIKSSFHICDNSQANYGTEDYDRLFKVRALYDHVQANCKKLDVPEYLSIGLYFCFLRKSFSNI